MFAIWQRSWSTSRERRATLGQSLQSWGPSSWRASGRRTSWGSLGPGSASPCTKFGHLLSYFGFGDSSNFHTIPYFWSWFCIMFFQIVLQITSRGVSWKSCLKRKGRHHKYKEHFEKIKKVFCAAENRFMKHLQTIVNYVYNFVCMFVGQETVVTSKAKLLY